MDITILPQDVKEFYYAYRRSLQDRPKVLKSRLHPGDVILVRDNAYSVVDTTQRGRIWVMPLLCRKRASRVLDTIEIETLWMFYCVQVTRNEVAAMARMIRYFERGK